MTKSDSNEPERLRLHPSQLIAGALAAVTGAALSARLGVAGTLAGTAAISFISGIASAIYEHSVKRGRVAVVNARARLSELQSMSTRRIEPDGAPAADELSDPEPARAPLWNRMPRRRLAYAGAAALATFVLAIGIITSIELVHGKPLSGSGNGTTITRAFEPGGGGQKRPVNPPASDDPSPSDTPTPSAPESSTSPSDQPSQTPSQQPSKKKQSPKPSQHPSDEPSQQPSDSPSAPESGSPPEQTPSQAPSDPGPTPTPSDMAPPN